MTTSQIRVNSFQSFFWHFQHISPKNALLTIRKRQIRIFSVTHAEKDKPSPGLFLTDYDAWTPAVIMRST